MHMQLPCVDFYITIVVINVTTFYLLCPILRTVGDYGKNEMEITHKNVILLIFFNDVDTKIVPLVKA